MTDEYEVATADDARLLPPGQWCLDATGTVYCLVDTHMGFPQRMAMSKGGRGFTALDNIAYPLHLADFDGECEHRWGANEMGHCRRCGQVSHDARPTHFDAEQMRVFRLAAEHNKRVAESADPVRCAKCGGPHPFHDPACVVHPDIIQDHTEQEPR